MTYRITVEFETIVLSVKIYETNIQCFSLTDKYLLIKE